MTRAQGARSKLALAFESAYGVAATSGFTQMPFVSTTIGAEQNLLANEVLGFGRDPLAPARDALNSDGNVVIPMDLNNLGFWMKGAFGQPISEGVFAASGQITFTAQPAVASSVVINGVIFTFVAAGAAGNQVNIGANLAATLTALAVVLNASVDPLVSVATYSSDATHLIVTHDTLGTIGNDFSLVVGAELLTFWNNPRNVAWTVSGLTVANSANTLGGFVLAVETPSGAGGQLRSPSTALVPGTLYRVRTWIKATSDVQFAMVCQPGNVTSRVEGPVGAPIIATEAAGQITNIIATDLGSNNWLYQFDFVPAAGIASGVVGTGRVNGSPAQVLTIYGSSVLVSSTATADPFLTGGRSGHTFKSGAWDLPSMTLETQIPEVPRYALYTGAVVDEFSYEMRRSGLLQMSVKLICQGEDIEVASQAGALESLAYERFGHFNGAVRRDGVDLGNVTQARFGYMNNLDRIDAIQDDGRIAGAYPSIAGCKGQIVVRFADTVLMSQAQSGAPCELVFDHQITATKRFTITVHAVYLPIPRAEISGPGGIEVTFDWQAALDPTNGRMATVVLINDVEAY